MLGWHVLLCQSLLATNENSSKGVFKEIEGEEFESAKDIFEDITTNQMV